MAYICKLTKKSGFAQRHCHDPRPTGYLPSTLLNYTEKYWRSPVTMTAVRKDVFEFSNRSKNLFETDYDFKLAVKEAYDAFRLPHPVKMLHLNDVFKMESDIWTSSPGLPWKELGYQRKCDVRDDIDAVNKVRKFWHFVKHGSPVSPPDCCAFVRSHVVPYGESKVRAVWGYPATLTFGEAVFAKPLIEAYMQLRTSPIAYGYETAKRGTAKLFREISSYSSFAAIDFKKFDKTVPAWLINIAFDILARNIDFVYYRDRGIARFDDMIRMYRYIQRYFIYTPIRLCNGERYRKFCGIASGSFFTQLIGSIVNFIVITWCCKKYNISTFIRVLGDDSILAANCDLSVVDFNKWIEMLGMRVNKEKTVITSDINDLTFLGYSISRGVPSKSREAWVTSLMFPENEDNCWNDVASRAMGLLWANLGVDEYFDALCRSIVLNRSFNYAPKRGMTRMLNILGIDVEDTVPPDRSYLLNISNYY